MMQSKNETVKLKNKGGKHGKKRGVIPTTVGLSTLRDRQINVRFFVVRCQQFPVTSPLIRLNSKPLCQNENAV